jgi:hypothetical protein
MSKFKSRKFWIAVGTVFSIAIAEGTGYDLSPETIAGIILVVSTYIIGQGIVDKSVVTAQVQVAGDVGRAQLELYARNLEEQLKVVVAELEINKAAVQLTLVPDLEE